CRIVPQQLGRNSSFAGSPATTPAQVSRARRAASAPPVRPPCPSATAARQTSASCGSGQRRKASSFSACPPGSETWKPRITAVSPPARNARRYRRRGRSVAEELVQAPGARRQRQQGQRQPDPHDGLAEERRVRDVLGAVLLPPAPARR